MRNLQQVSANTNFSKTMNLSNHQRRIPKPSGSTGSITDMYPIILDNGRTIIYTNDKSRESEIREKYARRL